MKGFDSDYKNASFAGEIVQSDLAVQIPVSLQGNKYFATLTGQYSSYTSVKGIAAKSKTPETFEAYKKSNIVRKYYPEGAQHLNSNGGGKI